MYEYMFLKSHDREWRTLKSEHDRLQQKVLELTQTVQELTAEIRLLNQENIEWEKNNVHGDPDTGSHESFERGKAEYNIP